MKRILLLSAAAPLALGFSHGTVETVMVKKGKNGDPFRMNKADFEADDSGDYTEVKGKDAEAAKGTRSDVNVSGNGEGGEVKTTAAPSAPDFSAPEAAAADPVDPVKQAVAPKATSADQLLVMKSTKGKTKGKFIIVDGTGAPIEGDRAKLLKIDPDGYDTEEAAKAVQTHTNPEPSPN